METYHRVDEALFDCQTSLLPLVPRGDAGDRSALWSLIPAAPAKFPWRGEEGTYITVSHDLRRRVNALCSVRKYRCAGPEQKFWKRVKSLAPEPDFWCYPGMTLQARRTDGKEVLNAVLYTVTDARADKVKLRRHAAYGEGEVTISLRRGSGRWCRWPMRWSTTTSKVGRSGTT